MDRKHTCPETDQPDVWVYDSTREGNFDDDGSLPKKISNKLQFGSGIIQKTNNGKITKRINYLIADASSGPSDPVTPSGLMYTCDEFPFARLVDLSVNNYIIADNDLVLFKVALALLEIPMRV